MWNWPEHWQRRCQAVEQVVDYCIRNGTLEEFFSDNCSEAITMSIFEYNEEQHLKSEREQAYRSGKREGIEEGKRDISAALFRTRCAGNGYIRRNVYNGTVKKG